MKCVPHTKSQTKRVISSTCIPAAMAISISCSASSWWHCKKALGNAIYNPYRNQHFERRQLAPRKKNTKYQIFSTKLSPFQKNLFHEDFPLSQTKHKDSVNCITYLMQHLDNLFTSLTQDWTCPSLIAHLVASVQNQ